MGTKGAILADSHNINIALLPPKALEGVESDRPESLPVSRGQYHDWIHACRGGDALWARFEYSATLNELLMLGDVATRFPGQRLVYDPVAGRIADHPEADRALGYEYCKGWSL